MNELKEIFKPFAKSAPNMERLNGINCICYTRVSSKEQAEGYSLEIQKKSIEEYADKNNLRIISYFGGTYESAQTDERKEFNRMLQLARRSKEKITYILVYSVDRFSRSGANAIYIASELRKENIKIFAVTQPSDTFTSSGKFQQNVQFVFSEYDNDLRREKCVAGMKEMLKKGYWPSKAPLGYDQRTTSKMQSITVNETGRKLRKAFYWKAEENLTNVEIRERLEAMGIKMSIQQMTEMFRNPFYCGILSHNLLCGEVVEGKQEKLISKEMFLQINEVKKDLLRVKQKEDFLETPLKHYVKCMDCGTPFTGYIVKKKGIYYYKCNKKGCKCNKNAKMMHHVFKEVLGLFQIDENIKEVIKDEFYNYVLEMNEQNKENETLYKSQLTETQKKIEKLEERFALDEIDRELYQKFSAKFRLDKKEILQKIEECSLDLSNLKKQLNTYVEFCLNLPKLWELSNYKAKKEIQNLIFPEGIYYDRKIEYYRTKKINSVIFQMSQLARDLQKEKSGKSDRLSEFSALVDFTDKISNQLLKDIETLSSLKRYISSH